MRGRSIASLGGTGLPTHVAVVVVHGIRTGDTDYSRAFRERVTRRIARLNREFVEWREVFWGDITHGNQRAYFERARHQGHMRYINIRWEFVLQGLGDAAAYIRTRTMDGAAYHQIQDRVSSALDQLDIPDLPDRILVLVGHSLGCQIISSYIWDTNRLKQASSRPGDNDAAKTREMLAAATPFRRLDTLAGIVTLGSNIPVFTFAFSPKRVIPVTRPRASGESVAFPGPALTQRHRETARWLNFYNPFDILGYPLKPLNPAYHDAVSIDKVVYSGFPFFFMPSRAHEGYWLNSTVIRHTARLLNALIG